MVCLHYDPNNNHNHNHHLYLHHPPPHHHHFKSRHVPHFLPSDQLSAEAMILDVGVVHADPHPGNFIVTRVQGGTRRQWAESMPKPCLLWFDVFFFPWTSLKLLLSWSVNHKKLKCIQVITTDHLTGTPNMPQLLMSFFSKALQKPEVQVQLFGFWPDLGDWRLKYMSIGLWYGVPRATSTSTCMGQMCSWFGAQRSWLGLGWSHRATDLEHWRVMRV